MQLDIYRSGVVIYTVDIGADTVYKHEIMGAHTITSEFLSTVKLDLFIGDYIIFKGENYAINVTPQVQKISAERFRYNVIFEGLVYKLYDKLFMDEGVSDFNYYGTPTDLVQHVCDNMNEIDAGWVVAFADTAPAQNIQFTNISCRQALTQIAQAFKMEYSLSGKEISIRFKIGNVTTLNFQYGRGKGLYNLTRKPIQDANLVTRVYGFGADKNLDTSYRGGVKRLIFDDGTGKPYLEKNVDIYGVKEGQYTDETIYPHRVGTVSAVDAASTLNITDAGLSFDVNAYLLSGVTAQISFLTGALEGYTFDINAYDATLRRIYFNQFNDSNDYLLPNTLNKPAVGDTYVLLNIKMPQTYIDAAEALLKAGTQTFLDQNSNPVVTYELSIDEKHARINNIELHVGDEVTILDTDLNVNNLIRCTTVSFPIVNPFLITAQIADIITYNVQEKTIAQTINNQTQIINIDRTQQENQRINSILYKKLKDLIFDPDGYFKNGDTSSLTVETGMLTVGLPSQNFSIDGVTIEPNYGGDVNSFHISAGTLFHNVYEITGLGNVWNINGATVSVLDPDTSYYVYARCSKTSLIGDWKIDSKQHDVDSEVGYWNFNLGILFSVIGGQRAFRFTNGMTYVFGDNVVCGMVRSVDGTQYIDLNHSKFWFGISGNSIDFDVTNPATLTIDGALVTKMIFAEDADIINLVIDTLVTTKPTDIDPNPQRVEIKKSTNSLKFFIEGEADPVVKIDVVDDVISGGTVAGMNVTDPVTAGKVSEVTLNGIFSNCSNHLFFPTSTGISTNSSVVGLLQRRTTDILPNGLSAGVAGVDQTDDTDGNSQSFGGWFNSIFTGGLFVGSKTISGDYTATLQDTHIVCSSNCTVLLPEMSADVYVGKIILVFCGAYAVVVDGNGLSMSKEAGFVDSYSIDAGTGKTVMAVFTGIFWAISVY